jgi:aspartyl-tRNA(Asn)/glutamyl-tRNA(Gln) amidotransferase subunit A
VSRAAGREALAAIGEDEPSAYVAVFDEPHLARDEGPLFGYSLAVKDNLALAGRPLTCASEMLADHEAAYTATVVERAADAGAAIVTKANMDEFACGSRGERSAFGATDNPAAPARVPGGSSSGCGAALAAGHVDLALGTDTGGSVRCPAAYCGAAALKPTRGRCSRWGLVDLAMSLDQPGPMARDVEGLARLYEAIAGPDPEDPSTLDEAPEPALDRVREPGLSGTVLGVPAELPDAVSEGVRRRFTDAVDTLRGSAASVREVELPDAQRSLSAYYVTCYAEFASAMHKFDGTVFGPDEAQPRRRLGREVKRRILLGTFITAREHRSAWYERARGARQRLSRAWRDLFADVDLVLTPTMPTAPPERGQVPSPVEEAAADVLTVPANLAGLPAGSVPTEPLDAGPVGLQVVGPPGDEASVLAAMRRFEEARG